MEETMLAEAKEHISSGFDKYLSAAGVNTMVSNRQPLTIHTFSLLVNTQRNRWTGNLVPLGTLSWVKDSHLTSLVRLVTRFISIMEVKSQYCFSKYEDNNFFNGDQSGWLI